jgi:hypothetical protein
MEIRHAPDGPGSATREEISLPPERQSINAPGAPQALGSYAQTVQVTGASRILHISGQTP